MSSNCSECGSSKEELIPSPETLARYQRLLKSNEAPGSAETAYVRTVTSKTAARLASLDQDICQLRNRLHQLEAERAQLSEYHSQNSAILSPLRRMPSEILAEVFSSTLPSFAEMGGKASDIERSPWILTQVSSRWRKVAVSTPSLWQKVYIDCSFDATMYPPPEMIQAQVERSCPLKLQVHFYGSEKGDSASQLRLFEILAEHSARWEELSIQLTGALVLVLPALRGRVPSLQRLWIQWCNADSQAGVESIKCFETASSLLDAGVDHEVRFVPVLLPVHQLTRYGVEGPWEMHQRFLKLATNLVEATILVQTSSAPWPAPLDESIDLLHLQRLNVSEIKVLDYIRAPALSEIGVGLAGEDPFECLDPFILRSSCTPSRLCITGCPDANTTAAILKKYPLITSLNLMFCSDDNEAVDEHSTMLTVGVPPLVSPHLYEIRFGIVPPMRVDYPLFLKMLQSRRREPYRALGVAEFLAYGDHDVDPVTLVGMDSLREGGLHLVVESDQKTCIDRWVYSCPWN